MSIGCTPALLALADGTLFDGVSIGADTLGSVGELVFNTAITGYQEILTDPSYAGQTVALTYPHIGNTGVNPEDQESSGCWGTGLVVRDVPSRYSNWRTRGSLSDYLRERGVPGIAGVDVRMLTRHLRTAGAQVACLQTGELNPEAAVSAACAHPGLAGMDLVREVTTADPYLWREGCWDIRSGYSEPQHPPRYRVVAYDFGIKRNILRLLVAYGCEVRVVPAQTSAEQVLAHEPDGVFLSNGPGDPEPCGYAIAATRDILAAGIPVFGICLGHQLLALASGAQTEKMKFGHHGANHPVQDLTDQRVLITSQNHGFAVSENGLPECLEVTHRSLFDGSVQGIAHREYRAFGFQGHPEASPGPQEASALFERFTDMMDQHRCS